MIFWVDYNVCNLQDVVEGVSVAAVSDGYQAGTWISEAAVTDDSINS